MAKSGRGIGFPVAMAGGGLGVLIGWPVAVIWNPVVQAGMLPTVVVILVLMTACSYVELEHLWPRYFGRQRFRTMRTSPGAGFGFLAPFSAAFWFVLFATWFVLGDGGVPR